MSNTFLGRWPKWLNWWTLLCLPGFGVALNVWGPLVTVYVASGIGFLTVLSVIGLLDDQGATAERKVSRDTIGGALRIAACTVTACVTIALVGNGLGGVWLLLAAAMGLTTPPCVGAIRRLRARASRWAEPESEHEATPPAPSGSPREEEAPEPLSPDPLQAMSAIELCFLWRHSFWELSTATSPAARARIAARRQLILDELFARDAPAIEEWLSTGPRASASPERYFHDDDHGQPAAA